MRPVKLLQSSPTLLALSGHDVVLPPSGPGVLGSMDTTTGTSRKTTRQHVLLDTRTFQDLEPLRLPSKLRERITKAQRRAAAEKDGVSIFTANATTSLLSSLHQGDDREPQPKSGSSSTAAAVAAGRKSSSSLSKTRQRESKSPSQPQVPVATTTPPASGTGLQLKPKMHLPDVILGHKMREFEAKMSVNALFVDPLEKNLHHLTIDEKEKVMLKMQDKIQQITAQVDGHFVQLKEQLDANGIFDSAANYQRAQALCLVELQKKCKLEKIRDDAMKEVLGDDRAAGDDASRARGGALSQMEGKLNELLAQKQRDADYELACTETTRLEAARVLAMSHLQRTTKSSALKRRPGVVAPPAAAAAGTANTTTRGILLSPVKRLQLQQNKNVNKNRSNQIDHEGEEVGIVERGDRFNTTVVTGRVLVVGSTATSTTESDWTSRHPHIAHVLAHLNATGDATTTTTGAASAVDSVDSFSSRGNAGDSSSSRLLDDTPSATSGVEWTERSSSYQTIAMRVNQELLHRRARWRWDATSHFYDVPPLQRENHTFLSTSLLQRLHYRQRNTASARLREEDERLRQLQRDETNGDKRKKADALYQQLQETIQSKRLKADLRRVGSAAGRAGTRASTAGSRGPSSRGEATRRAATSEGTTRKQLKQQAVELPADPQTLLVSASAPALGTTELLDPGASHPLDQAEFRRSQFDRKLVVAPGLLGQARTGTRHHSRLRGGSRIGAPSFTDLTTLGHHSNIRMEERRSSAQTWAWHQPSGQLVSSGSSPGATAAAVANGGSRHYHHGGGGDDDYDSDVDDSERRDAMGVVEEEDHDNDDNDEGGDDNENDDSSDETHDDDADDDGDDDDDDARSLRSSVSSVRSSFSVVAKAKKLPHMKPSPSKKRGHAALHGRHRQIPRASTRRGISPGRHLNARTSFSSSASGSGGGMFANIQFTANAQVLQNRLEAIWRALEFPFSTKLLMLEKYADLSDSDALAQALGQWETAVEMVVVREKLKHVLAEYEELHEIKESSRLAPADWSYLHMQQLEVPVNAINLATESLVQWIHEHMDAITQRCEKMAQQLKAKTGDELTFQGRRYPPRV